jgi:hypothetical protein
VEMIRTMQAGKGTKRTMQEEAHGTDHSDGDRG